MNNIYQRELFGWVVGKRSLKADVAKTTVRQRSHDPSQVPAMFEKNLFYLFCFTQPVKNNMFHNLGISDHAIILFDLDLKTISEYFRYAEEDKAIERERREAGKNNY